ncbi:MAG: MarR family transcriptional regulator [Nanoarchaeota archaeon]|nr:MarR family transcriptional regulator [Nanoarchaeota archaeon]MBU1622481.1 MarR family transcriptional regulator [Nanoarchaeota archaeon]
MKNKHVGLLVMGITLLFLLIVFSFNNALDTIVATSCEHGISCPMQITLDTQRRISYGLIGLLVIVGAFIAFFMKEDKENKNAVRPEEPKRDFSLEEVNLKLENLDEDEKAVVNVVVRENGSAYQSDLIKEVKMSKVKMTRVLDKLEGKGLIERKRRGMTNIVIMK